MAVDCDDYGPAALRPDFTVVSGQPDPKMCLAINTLPGVAVLEVSAMSAEGLAHLRASDDGTILSYRAPGSSTYGPSVDCGADGDYLLQDGDDSDEWVRVRVATAYLTAAAGEAAIFVRHTYNDVANDDVTAVEAASGDVEAYTIDLVNRSTMGLSSVSVWIESLIGFTQPSNVTGVTITDVSAANGAGNATLGFERVSGTPYLYWTPPGESIQSPVEIIADGSIKLQFGLDATRYCWVTVDFSELPVSATSDTIVVSTTNGIEISSDGASWVTPTTEGTALVLDDVAPGATATLHVQRTIGAGASADGKVEVLLHAAWCGL